MMIALVVAGVWLLGLSIAVARLHPVRVVKVEGGWAPREVRLVAIGEDGSTWRSGYEPVTWCYDGATARCHGTIEYHIPSGYRPTVCEYQNGIAVAITDVLDEPPLDAPYTFRITGLSLDLGPAAPIAA